MILLAFRLAITLVAVDLLGKLLVAAVLKDKKNYIAGEDPERFFTQAFYMPSRNVISAVMSHFARC